MAKKTNHLALDEPICHQDHRRPLTRREFLGQGFMAGLGVVTAPTLFSLFANPRAALIKKALCVTGMPTFRWTRHYHVS